MEKIRVGVVGASGYSGGELLRLLLRHPHVEISSLTSRQYSGQPLGEVFPRFKGVEKFFEYPDPETLAEQIDVAFLALPNRVASEFAPALLRANVKVLDISADFRLSDPQVYAAFYGGEHPAPELLAKAVYGLPELYRAQLSEAQLVACPGCYPTGAILPLAPMLREGMVEPSRICVTSMSGVTGAGRKSRLPLLFGECNESMRAYQPVGHRHQPEIEEQLGKVAGLASVRLSFVPHLMPVSRGIISTIYAPHAEGVTAEQANAALVDAYEQEPFVRVLETENELPDTKHVTMTNVCEISCSYDERTGQLILNSAIDNLTKGAAGQAIQAMNALQGMSEKEGLEYV